MATAGLHPFMDFAAAQEARIPFWALMEHAVASGVRGIPSQCQQRMGQPPHAGCSRQAHPPRRPPPGVNCHEFLTNAAAMAEAFLGGNKTQTSETATNAEKKVSTSRSADTFEVNLDVSEYEPSELNVKTVEGSIVVEGKQEEKKDKHGFVARSFKRRITLPDDVKAENVTCKLASNGILILSAPISRSTPVTNEREIPISFTGRPVSIPKEPIASAVPAKADMEVEESKETEAVADEVSMSAHGPEEDSKLD